MAICFNIALANRVININALFETSYYFCKNYITDAVPDFCVSISQEDIQFERNKADEENNFALSNEYLETLAIYRKIASSLIEYNTLLFHGSAISVDGEGYLFTAKSGTGKSTHTRLWREYFGERALMINDDKPLLQITENGVIVYGTPWDGKHHLSTNTSVPLKAICILERDKTNHIINIDKRDAFPMLCQQAYRPREPKALIKALSLIDRLGSNVELYRLGCNMEKEAAKVAYYGMNTK